MDFKYHHLRLNQYAIFYLDGKLNNSDNGLELIADIESKLALDNKQVVLDCQKLSYINSSGLNVFIRLLTKIRNSGGELYFTNVNAIVSKIFTVSKLNQIFNIYPTTEMLLETKNVH